MTKFHEFLFRSSRRPTEKENKDNNFVNKNRDKHNFGCWVRACMSPSLLDKVLELSEPQTNFCHVNGPSMLFSHIRIKCFASSHPTAGFIAHYFFHLFSLIPFWPGQRMKLSLWSQLPSLKWHLCLWSYFLCLVAEIKSQHSADRERLPSTGQPCSWDVLSLVRLILLRDWLLIFALPRIWGLCFHRIHTRVRRAI